MLKTDLCIRLFFHKTQSQLQEQRKIPADCKNSTVNEAFIRRQARTATSHRVWVNPSNQQQKLQPYLQQLPQKVPTPDAFALKKHEQGNALYTQSTEIGDIINLLGGALLQQQKQNSVEIGGDIKIYRRLLKAEIMKIKKEDFFEFYREVAKEFQHNK